MPNHNENLERLLDLISEYLISSDIPNIKNEVQNSQKYIRDGKLQLGDTGGVLALFQKDIKANQEDLNNLTTLYPGTEQEEVIPTLLNIANSVDFNTLEVSSSIVVDNGLQIYLKGGGANFPDGGLPITQLLIGDNNPINLSQFIPLNQEQTNIDIKNAEEFLDTNIFELLPSGDTRQARIIRFFNELNALLPPLPGQEGQPPFDFNNDNVVDRDNNSNWVSSSLYDQNTSISYAQDNPFLSNIEEEDSFIHRLKINANDSNNNRTIQDIYNRVLPYLTDILEDEISPQDDRPVYQNQSNGYLKFRNLNQGIIIRNTNQEFIEGLDPNNLTYLNRLDENGNTIPGTGFTITMWVRFLDKVSEGTLFNFGNPLREVNPFGFKLETFVLNKDERTFYAEDGEPVGEDSSLYTWGSTVENFSDLSNQGIFSNSNSARFVRLQVRDGNEGLRRDVRDSHVGNNMDRKISWSYPELNYRDGEQGVINLRLINSTFIPEDFNEWYFICASYDPTVIEPNDGSAGAGIPIETEIFNEFKNDKDFWLNHKNPNSSFTNFSGFGNKCKVEIISKTDLLRARGFKVD